MAVLLFYLEQGGGGGGGGLAAPVGEQVALLQRKIEQSSSTLRMLQGMGQTGAAITELQQEVRDRQQLLLQPGIV